MKNPIRKLFSEVKGAMDIAGTVVDVVLVVALLPVVYSFITGVNASPVETLLLSLVTLFIVLGLIFNIGRQTGLIKQ